jgi:hypothetical protein
MPGYLPGIPGLIAFAGAKFAGYVLAGRALKHFQPSVTAGSVKIAATRTGLGIVLGPVLSIGMVWAASIILGSESNLPILAFYPFLFVVRTFVWAFVIFVFTNSLGLSRLQIWKYSILGAVWSCVLDLPGFYLALISPGHIPFC